MTPLDRARPMITLSEPCDARPIVPLALWRAEGWTLKPSAILYRGEPLRADLLADARRVVEDAMRTPLAGGHGVGFVGIHQGRGFDIVFLGRWANENELFHRIWWSDARPARLRDPIATTPTACVWDLRVMGYERDAWLAHVLRDPSGPNVDAYLAARIDELA